jgi:hypothetical protein
MNILSIIVSIFVALLTLSFPAWIVAGIVLLVKAAHTPEPAKKKGIRWWGISVLVFPFVAMFLLMSVWGLIAILTNTFHQ